MRAGDRGVLRDPSRHAVAAGVLVLDADPPPLARRGAARQRAAELSTARAAGCGERDRAARCGPRDHLAALGIDAGDDREIAGWLIAPDTWQRWVDGRTGDSSSSGRAQPARAGMPLAALAARSGCPTRRCSPRCSAEAGLTVAHGRRGARRSRRRSVRPKPAMRAVEAQLRSAPFEAPDRDATGRPRPRPARAGRGRARRPAAAHQRRHRAAARRPRTAPLRRCAALPQPFTTSQARAALDTTRRVCIPLLEYLDRIGRTERVDAQLRRLR